MLRWPLVFYAGMRRNGRAIGPLIFIRKDLKDDRGVYLHELEHVKQWFMTLSLHPLLYLLRPYRQWSEMRAKLQEIRVAADKDAAIRREAESLAHHYRLNKPADYFITKLRERI